MSCFVDVGRIYEVYMNPTHRSWEIQHSKCSNAIKIYKGIISEFYMEVSHLCWVVNSLLQVSADRLLVAVKTDYHDLTLIRPLVYLLSSRHLLPSPISIENEVAESILTMSLRSFTDLQSDPLALRLALDCCSLVRMVCLSIKWGMLFIVVVMFFFKHNALISCLESVCGLPGPLF